jgi:SAM-dependent methyltransferase
VSVCCSTYADVADEHFDPRIAQRDLDEYRTHGAGSTTGLLRDLLVETHALEGVLLDVGSGIGALTFELLDCGISTAIDVDASSAHLAAAAEEAARRGQSGAIQFVRGDFLDRSRELPQATVVTLDRVICCYPHYEPLLRESLRHAQRFFAISYPRDRWLTHCALGFENAVRRLRRARFRTFVHPADQMADVIRHASFVLAARRQTRLWSADVYSRSDSA